MRTGYQDLLLLPWLVNTMFHVIACLTITPSILETTRALALIFDPVDQMVKQFQSDFVPNIALPLVGFASRQVKLEKYKE